MTAVHPFDDLINFLAQLAPEEVIGFKPSQKTIARVQWLLEQEKSGVISSEEKSELEHFLLQEDLMIIAKARARLQLSNS